MVIIFDLDDTLYEEKQFVFSGYLEVAKWISQFSNTNYKIIFDFMVSDFYNNGRGLVFDNALNQFYVKNKKNIKKCLSIYRLHKPNIKLDKNIKTLLKYLALSNELYIVTDGNKIVQNNKIKSLNLDQYVKKAFITYRYGLKSSKPSLNCFEMIRKIENSKWNSLVYIGDNPNKDFVNLNKVGAITIRVLQGDYAKTKATSEYDAKYKINNLTELKALLINKI